MQLQDLQNEILQIESKIAEQEKLFDKALESDQFLREAKKIFHQIRLLRDRRDELIDKKESSIH